MEKVERTTIKIMAITITTVITMATTKIIIKTTIVTMLTAITIIILHVTNVESQDIRHHNVPKIIIIMVLLIPMSKVDRIIMGIVATVLYQHL